MSEKSKITLIGKPTKGKMKGLAIVFLWILLWNVIFQLMHHSEALHHLQFGSVEIVNWAFFLSVTVFFMQEELNYIERFLRTAVGGTVGLLISSGVILGVTAMVKSGMNKTASLCSLLAIALILLIFLEPILPMFFNNVGFCYFIVSLADSSTTVEKLPSHIISLLLGSVILNLGCTLLLTLYKKSAAKKATKK